MGDGEEATEDGGQKDCLPGWMVVLERDCEEGDEEGVTLLLTALPLLLMPLTLELLLGSPVGAPIVPSIPNGLTKPF